MMLDTCDPKSKYVLHLADDALILGQRLSGWCGHGPILEQDIAVSNISLDLIGLARQYYQYAAELIGNESTEDSLAYFRESREFYNHLIVEQPNGDWGDTMARQFYFDTFHFFQLQKLTISEDLRLREIATKALKETTYHAQFSAEWIIRLGDGTQESHQRIQKSISHQYPFALEFFETTQVDKQAHELNIGPDVVELKGEWTEKVSEILSIATLDDIDPNAFAKKGGKRGIHSEEHGLILAEMQSVARSYPNAKW
jgi:ring-1,2-phenylacetyl-CoA epoxidase subunit PaaC